MQLLGRFVARILQPQSRINEWVSRKSTQGSPEKIFKILNVLIQFQHVNSQLFVNNCKTLQVQTDNKSLKMWFENIYVVSTEHYWLASTEPWWAGCWLRHGLNWTELRSWELKTHHQNQGVRGDSRTGLSLTLCADSNYLCLWCELLASSVSAGSTTGELWLRQDWDVWLVRELTAAGWDWDNTPTLQHSSSACRPTLVT